MRALRILVSLLTLILVALPAHAGDQPPHLPLDPHAIEPASLFTPLDLSSTWLLRTGDDPSYASPTLDDSGWQVVRSSQLLSSYGIRNPDLLWYRTHVRLPPGSRHLALLLRDFNGSEQIFVNGVLTGPSTEFPPGGISHSSQTRIADLPDAVLASGDLTIAVRCAVRNVYVDPHTSVGFTASTILLLGTRSNLQDLTSLYFFRSFTSNGVIIGLNGLLLLLAGALAFVLRGEREYPPLVVYLAASLIARLLVVWVESGNRPYLPLITALLGLLQAAVLIAGVEFARFVLDIRRSRSIVVYEWTLAVFTTLFLIYVSALVELDIAPAPIVIYSVRAVLVLIQVPVLLGLPFFALWVWWRRRLFDALLLSVPLIFQSGFAYYYVALFFLVRLHLVASDTAPHAPIHVIATDWAEVGELLFLLALFLFLTLRTVRIARSRAALAAEFKAAESVQHLLLAGSGRPILGFTVESIYLPASEVGGDFFLVSPSPGGSIVAIVGDVSGKGLTAAMRVAMILGVLRRERSPNPSHILASLNEALLDRSGLGFTTACCIHLQADGSYTVANAGHIAPYVAGDGHSRELQTPPALPLGLAPDQTYDLTQGSISRTQRLVLLSDGVPEARAPRGELYGFDRLPSLSLLSAHDIASTAQRFGQEDDITVLTIALKPA